MILGVLDLRCASFKWEKKIKIKNRLERWPDYFVHLTEFFKDIQCLVVHTSVGPYELRFPVLNRP
jgi:hypothetical protein